MMRLCAWGKPIAAGLAAAVSIAACHASPPVVTPAPPVSTANRSPTITPAITRPAVDSALSTQVYYSFQVDKPAVLLPDQGPVPYPAELRASGFQGQVLMQFVVDTSGRPLASTFKALRSSHPLFTAAVRAKLPEYRFSPAQLHGKRVVELVQMPFAFRLQP